MSIYYLKDKPTSLGIQRPGDGDNSAFISITEMI